MKQLQCSRSGAALMLAGLILLLASILNPYLSVAAGELESSDALLEFEAVAAFVGNSIGADRGDLEEQVRQDYRAIMEAFRANESMDESLLRELHLSLARRYALIGSALTMHDQSEGSDRLSELHVAQADKTLSDIKNGVLSHASDDTSGDRIREFRIAKKDHAEQVKKDLAQAVESEVQTAYISRELLPPPPETVMKFGEEVDYVPSASGDRILATLGALDSISTSTKSARDRVEESVTSDLISLMLHLPVSDEDDTRAKWAELESSGEILNLIPSLHKGTLIIDNPNVFADASMLLFLSKVNPMRATEGYHAVKARTERNGVRWSEEQIEKAIQSEDYVQVDLKTLSNSLRLKVMSEQEASLQR